MERIIGIDSSMKGCGIYSRGEDFDCFFTFTDHIKEDYETEVEADGKTLCVTCKRIPKDLSKVNKSDPFLRTLQLAQPCVDFLVDEMDACAQTKLGIFLEDSVKNGSGRNTQLAEYVALLKRAVYTHPQNHRIHNMYSPSTIKKNIWGHGRAQKLDIFEAGKKLPLIGKALEKFVADGHPVRDDSWMIDFLDAWGVTEMAVFNKEVGGFDDES